MIYTFKCPVCSKKLQLGSSSEPCCTGPSEARDDHELTVMFLYQIDYEKVDPVVAKQRAAQPLILPAVYNP